MSDSSSTPVGTLLLTVGESILEVFLVCFAGWILARNGILDKGTQKKINRINVSLLTPCLLFSKVAFTLNPSKLKELWIIPATFVVVTAVSAGVAWLLGTLLRLKRSQRNFGIATAMFNNSNSLPIALMQSLVLTVKGLKWGPNDSKDAMIGCALTYLVLYSTLGMMLRWSYGVHLLASADDEVTLEVGPAETTPLISPVEASFPRYGARSRAEHEVPSSSIRHTPSITFSAADDEESRPSSSRGSISSLDPIQALEVAEDTNRLLPARASIPRKGHGSGPVFFSFPNTPVRSSLDLDEADDGEDEWSTALPRPGSPDATVPTPLRSSLSRLRDKLVRAVKATNAFMTIPLWAALASLVVACIPPLQHVLEWHVRPVRGALKSLGNCSIPLTILVLGAYFYGSQPELETRRVGGDLPVPGGSVHKKGSEETIGTLASLRNAFRLRRVADSTERRAVGESRKGETKTVFVAVVSRMILTPMILLPLVALFARFDIHRIFEDPVFVVSNVLLISSPPALTLAQITQAASGDAFERLISRTMLWAYCVFTPPLTIIYVVIGLVLAKL